MTIDLKTMVKMASGIAILGICFFYLAAAQADNTQIMDRPPLIDPDYCGVTIPPNMAPLNFMITEPGIAARVTISSANGAEIGLRSKNKKFSIPIKKWKKLLAQNAGNSLKVAVSVQDSSGNWQAFAPIINHISTDSIDSHVAYRLINPGYVLWWEMGLYQRDIQTFKETPIITNRVTSQNCMNCHSFCKNDPDKMLFHMRGDYGGTMLFDNGTIRKINTSTDYTMSAGVYPSWHPDGKHVAFSVNKINQFFHATSEQNLHVADKASDIIVYDIEKNQVTTCPQISTKNMENLPTWSHDGQFLYYISSPELQPDQKYDTVDYDLMKISYNAATNTWGEPQTALSAAQTGSSITFPKPSPDGKYLLLTLSDFGYFTIHSKSADLYLMDLQTNEWSKSNVNSDFCESYHSWSSNSKWFVFVSKRRDGLCSRLYFSHIDENGNASKPVLLPQKDPEFYKTFIENYNRPEMIKSAVAIKYADMIRAARQAAIPVQFDSTVNVDALSGATRFAKK